MTQDDATQAASEAADHPADQEEDVDAELEALAKEEDVDAELQALAQAGQWHFDSTMLTGKAENTMMQIQSINLFCGATVGPCKG